MSVLYSGLFKNGHTVVSPVVGECRYDHDKDTMQTWDGRQWVTLYGHKETVQETVQESLDRVASQVEDDHPDSVAIQDALKEWEQACEKFKVVLALAEKNK
jgi:hypothetical protein